MMSTASGRAVAADSAASRLLKTLGLAVGLVVLLLPLLATNAIMFKSGIVLIFFVGAIGMHVILNWAGDLSLAHGVMVGLPALVCLAISEEHGVSPVYLLPIAIAVGAAEGAVVAIPTLRASGVQVALVTLIAGIAIDRFFFGQTWLVGTSAARSAAAPRLGPLELVDIRARYIFLLTIVVLAVTIAWLLTRSKSGRAWRWIRGNSTAAAAFGIPTVRYRIGAYATGGAFGGLAGGLTVIWVQHLGPGSFPSTLAFDYLLVVILGGPGFLGGLFIGTLIVKGGPQFATDIFGTDVGETLDTLLAYAGPIGLIQVIVQHQAGFNGVGRELLKRVGKAPRRSSGVAEPSHDAAGDHEHDVAVPATEAS